MFEVILDYADPAYPELRDYRWVVVQGMDLSFTLELERFGPLRSTEIGYHWSVTIVQKVSGPFGLDDLELAKTVAEEHMNQKEGN